MSGMSDMNLFYALFDIDGTLKDLVTENDITLLKAMQKLGTLENTLRGKVVLMINKVNMYLVKTGLLPTNKFMQGILVRFYSLLLFKRYSTFKSKYFEEYNNVDIFFDDTEDKLNSIEESGLRIYMVTKNKQNKNILTLQENNPEIKLLSYFNKLIVGKDNSIKLFVYHSFMSSRKIQSSKVVIIGDNLWDDVLPALILGTKVVWVNKYNCGLKSFAISMLKLISKNVLAEEDIFSIK